VVVTAAWVHGTFGRSLRGLSMPLTLHAHPLSWFCQKVLVALYELEVPFEFRHLDLSDAGDTEAAARTKQEVGDELEVAYDLLEARLVQHRWLGGDAFTMADCAALPALFYASAVRAFEPGRPALAAYFRRVLERPSVARVLREAAPWLQHFPLLDTLPAEYRPAT
jgi:glutathione S-transferase